MQKGFLEIGLKVMAQVYENWFDKKINDKIHLINCFHKLLLSLSFD